MRRTSRNLIAVVVAAVTGMALPAHAQEGTVTPDECVNAEGDFVYDVLSPTRYVCEGGDLDGFPVRQNAILVDR